MKRKIFLTGALALLLAVLSFMAWDMFFNKPDGNVNPYAYDLNSLRVGDTSRVMYAEVLHFNPEMAVIHGIAVDKSDRIYVAGENSVEVFDHQGKTETRFPVKGTANCIHVDSAGMIYVGMEDHVEIFNRAGRQMKKWNSCADNAFITSIAVRGADVFLADAGNKVVYQFDKSGNKVKKIGEKDPARNIPGFVVPSPYFDLWIGRKGELWVVNPGRHRIEQYNHEGDLVFSWGQSSMSMDGFCGCCNPSNISMLSDGSFVTSEKAIERIKIYGPMGAFKYVVADPHSFREGTKGLDIAVDSKDRIVVLDPEKKQVRIFTLKKPQT